MFYHAALLKGVLTQKTESLFLDYYLTKPDGMYYIYDKPLNKVSDVFASREASCYLAALEVLAEYDSKDYFGKLEKLIPQYTEDDVQNFVNMSLCNLYHEICHRYIHASKEKNIARKIH